MAADEQGNDLGAVDVPITGRVAYAPLAQNNIIPKADMGASPLVFPPAWRPLGLVKVDGAPQETRESGDALEFWQIGYSLSGDGKRGLTVTAAENNAAVIALTESVEPDADGVYEIPVDIPSNRFLLFRAMRAKNGAEDRRQGVAHVTTIEPDQETRGEVKGVKITFEWDVHEWFDTEGNTAAYWMWRGKPGQTAPVTVTGVTAGTPGTFAPSNATLPANITALRALGSLSQSTAWTAGQYVVLGNGSNVHWDGTDWKTGIAE